MSKDVNEKEIILSSEENSLPSIKYNKYNNHNSDELTIENPKDNLISFKSHNIYDVDKDKNYQEIELGNRGKNQINYNIDHNKHNLILTNRETKQKEDKDDKELQEVEQIILVTPKSELETSKKEEE